MGIKKQEFERQQQEEDEIRRMKLPKAPEVFGIVEQRLGGSRMSVRCLDGKTRITRIPGRLKRKLWVREGDLVIVEPWEYDKEKGDILYKYKKSQVEWLQRSGKLKGLEDVEEF